MVCCPFRPQGTAPGRGAAGLSERSFAMRLAVLSALYSAGTAASIIGLVRTAELDTSKTPSLMGVALYALLFLPGLVAAGAFLALAFARNQRWIASLSCRCCRYVCSLVKELTGVAQTCALWFLNANCSGLLSSNRASIFRRPDASAAICFSCASRLD